MRATATTGIACAPERLFDVLADLRRETEWNSRRVLFALFAPVIRRDVPKQYASLKALCERG